MSSVYQQTIPTYKTNITTNKRYLQQVDPSLAGTFYKDITNRTENFGMYKPDISDMFDASKDIENNVANLHSQDIFQTKQIDFQDIYNNNGQYIDLQRRTLFPGLTIGESQQMQQANRLRQGNILLRDSRAYKTGNQIMDSTVFQNIARRVENTGQLLPAVTPYGGWQQGLTNNPSDGIGANQENFVKILDYDEIIKKNPQIVIPESETNVVNSNDSNEAKAEAKENYEDYDSQGKLMNCLKLFGDYQSTLPLQQQQYLINIVKAMITADKTSIYSQLKQSPEFESLPLMIKIKLYRLDKIITSGNINNI